MRNEMYVFGPMGFGIRPKQFFGATREMMKKGMIKNKGAGKPTAKVEKVNDAVEA